MGTKVNPTGFRLGQTKNWNSNWRTNKNDFSDKLHLDLQLKELIEVTLNNESILTGKLFIREMKTDKTFIDIKGTYYITQNFVNNLRKQQEKPLTYQIINEKVEQIVQGKLRSQLNNFLKGSEIKGPIEIDLVNLLDLGCGHSLKTLSGIDQQLRGPLSRAPYAKDLYILCHKMILLKDTTMLGKAIVPLLEKTTQHHLVVNNVEKICSTVFNQYRGINGFRLDFKGRIGGSARSRTRSLKLGSLSNQKIDSNIDYTLHEAVTRYGVCSLRIWLC